jgi:hypothetical protein
MFFSFKQQSAAVELGMLKAASCRSEVLARSLIASS